MGMQVDVHLKFLLLMLLNYGLLDRPDCRLLCLCRVNVITVEVLGKCVQPVVPTIDAIWVENWDYFEDKLIPQYFGLDRRLICQEFEDAIEDEGCRCFAGMDAACQKNGWLLEFKRPQSLITLVIGKEVINKLLPF